MKNSQEGLSSCQCSMILNWEMSENEDACVLNSKKFWNSTNCIGVREKISAWSSVIPLDPVLNRSGTGPIRTSRMEKEIELQILMVHNFAESGPPALRGTRASERGNLESKGSGKTCIHFCGDDVNMDLLLRTVISVNQVSIYGAVPDMCEPIEVREESEFWFEPRRS